MSTWPKSLKPVITPLFGHPVYFVDTPELWDKCMESVNCDSRAAGMAGLSCQLGNEDGMAFFIVGVFDGQLRTLVHELAHTTFHMLSHVGIPVDNGKPNEAYCYLLDTLVEMTPEKLKRILL